MVFNLIYTQHLKLAIYNLVYLIANAITSDR